MSFTCNCGMCFTTQLGYRFHTEKRCDNGAGLVILKNERIRAEIIDVFIDNFKLDRQTLCLEDDLERFIKIFNDNLLNKNPRNISFYIRDFKKDGCVAVKGFQDYKNKKQTDHYVSREWTCMCGSEFLNYIIEKLNKRIISYGKEIRTKSFNILKIDNINMYLKELKKISK